MISQLLCNINLFTFYYLTFALFID